MRKQNGHIVRISGRWYVRYWERRNIGGTVEQKRVSHCLGSITTRGKHPPADIEEAAEATHGNRQRREDSSRADHYHRGVCHWRISAVGSRAQAP